MRYMTYSPAQTQQLARRFAERLRAGDLVAFTGDLGAGKTTFTQGIAQALGVREPVTSPTYTVVNEYRGASLELFHFDLYRLSGMDDLFDIGWEEYLERGGVCVVEWSEKIAPELAGAIQVQLCRASGGDDARQITITGGERFENLGI